MFAQADSLECTPGAWNSHFEPTLSRARAASVSITYSFCGSHANCAPVGRVLSLFSRRALLREFNYLISACAALKRAKINVVLAHSVVFAASQKVF
jgi:hypothetical protein